MIVGLQVENRTIDVPNTKQESWQFNRDFVWHQLSVFWLFWAHQIEINLIPTVRELWTWRNVNWKEGIKGASPSWIARVRRKSHSSRENVGLSVPRDNKWITGTVIDITEMISGGNGQDKFSNEGVGDPPGINRCPWTPGGWVTFRLEFQIRQRSYYAFTVKRC